jgi:HNH endonuclease
MAIAGPLPPLELLQERFEEREPGVLRHMKDGDVAGYKDSKGYWKIRGYMRSRLIWKLHHGVDPRGAIDHINGTRDDDQIGNLRDVPAGINARNVGWHDGSSYVVSNEHSITSGHVVRFTILCWPDEDHEALAADLHELIAPEFDAIYANRVGRQRPGALEAAE